MFKTNEKIYVKTDVFDLSHILIFHSIMNFVFLSVFFFLYKNYFKCSILHFNAARHLIKDYFISYLIKL